jgi:hypothetical protein
MKILVIHPEDKSTDFLTSIYDSLGGFPDFKKPTVIRGGMTKEEVDEQIKQHDRIMMMGHGSPNGLFSVGQFAGAWGYVIDQTTVSLLQDKECIFIWCNADQFVNKHKLKGFYSGMFVSEVSEASYCGMPNTPQFIVEESNDVFAKEFGLVSDKPLVEAYEYVRDTYGVLAEDNPVAKYNHYRLYLNS